MTPAPAEAAKSIRNVTEHRERWKVESEKKLVGWSVGQEKQDQENKAKIRDKSDEPQ